VVAGSIDIHPAGADTGSAIVAAAASQDTYYYCNGGGGINGPTLSTDGSDCSTPGYDCMSLAQYAVYQVTGVTVPLNGEELPGPNSTDWDGQGTYIPSASTIAGDDALLSPGDVVFFGGSDMWHYAHSGIYAGNGEVWDALQTGDLVGQHSMQDLTSLYGDYDGGVLYTAGGTPPAFGVTTASLTAATIGTRYPGAQLSASGGTPPYKWKAKGLPKGLKVSAKTGAISGIVRNTKHAPAPGNYSVAIEVTDKSKPKLTATAKLTLTLDPAS